MMNHKFIFFTAVQIYDLSCIHNNCMYNMFLFAHLILKFELRLQQWIVKNVRVKKELDFKNIKSVIPYAISLVNWSELHVSYWKCTCTVVHFMLAYAFGKLDWAVNVSSHVFLQDCNESGCLLCYLVIKSMYDKINTVCYFFLFP